MARFLFVAAPAAAGQLVRFDTASGSSTPADVQFAHGQTIPGSTVRADSNSAVSILGPDNVSTLYQKTLRYDSGAVVGSPITLTAVSTPTNAGSASAVPASAAAAGTPGQTASDSGFFYVCVAANTWKRVAIASW